MTRLAHIDNADERTLSAHGIANDANVQFTPAVRLCITMSGLKPKHVIETSFLIRSIFKKQQSVNKVVEHAPLGKRKQQSVLLTGGLGGLGYLLTSYMIHVARSRNVLVGSTSGRASKLNPASTFSHALYNIIRTNIGLTDETRCALVGEGSFLASQLTTIIHAGGRLNDATISNQTVGKFCSVSSPKFIGLQRMAEAMMNSYALDNFLLFSSIASLIGSSGQINYAYGKRRDG